MSENSPYVPAYTHPNEKIERLEAELADLRHKAMHYESEVHELRAELADLRASSVLVRERCQTCGGNGYVWVDEKDAYESCPDCDNGWRLAEGVRHVVYSNEGPYYLVPVRLIEGDTDGE